MIAFKPNQQMLNDYIQNKLNDVDTEKLELWLADNPDVMQDLELDLMFKQSNFKISKTVSQKTNNLFDWFKLPSLLIGAVAASLIIVPMLRDDTPAISSNELFMQNEFVISDTRSTSEDITINTSSRSVSLKLPLQDEWLKDNEEFTVELKNPDGTNHSINILPNWDNELPLSLLLQSLQNQQVEIKIYAKDKVGEKPLSQYMIDIKIQGN